MPTSPCLLIAYFPTSIKIFRCLKQRLNCGTNTILRTLPRVLHLHAEFFTVKITGCITALIPILVQLWYLLLKISAEIPSVVSLLTNMKLSLCLKMKSRRNGRNMRVASGETLLV